MPPRIAYWTSSFEPDVEAVAGEVACLRRMFPGSVVWGVNARRPPRFSWRRGFGFPPRTQLAFRAVTGCLQRLFDLNHLFGGVGDWFHLRAIRRWPAVLTVAVEGETARPDLLAKIDQFVVEWPQAEAALLNLGVPRDRIRFIPPAVDLERFQPAVAPDSKFTVLFASSPDRADWLDARGMPLLLDVAERRADVRFRLVWRPWGDSLPAVRRSIDERGLQNIDLLVGRFANMAAHYHAAHATFLPFNDPRRCKPAPNSLIEGLACGRPGIMTQHVGLATIVAEAGAGICCEGGVEEIIEAIDRLRADWNTASRCARQLAERRFGVNDFITAYTQIYEALA